MIHRVVNSDDITAMWEAISMADLAMSQGEPPFGAVIVNSEGIVVAKAHDQVNTDHDMTSHAETLTVRLACKAQGADLSGHTLYTTCEPCPMCYTSAWLARVDRIVYATTMAQVNDVLGDSQREIRMSVETINDYTDQPLALRQGVLEEECMALFLRYAESKNSECKPL
ncbi:MAG: tRNA(Arg) A34 adenosine deaminase TadA [Cellvibrionaceae bacterium]|jgi:tRNA(Arg) A34 adenosine deaminase TadA